MGLFSFLTQEIAIDLGTANTIIIMNDKVVVDEPSIIARDRQTGKTVAVGRQAQQMHGKTHENIKTIRPLKDGVIADFHAAEDMIKGMIKMINRGRNLFQPSLRMVICIPSGITEVVNLSKTPGFNHELALEIHKFKDALMKAALSTCSDSSTKISGSKVYPIAGLAIAQ